MRTYWDGAHKSEQPMSPHHELSPLQRIVGIPPASTFAKVRGDTDRPWRADSVGAHSGGTVCGDGSERNCEVGFRSALVRMPSWARERTNCSDCCRPRRQRFGKSLLEHTLCAPESSWRLWRKASTAGCWPSTPCGEGRWTARPCISISSRRGSAWSAVSCDAMRGVPQQSQGMRVTHPHTHTHTSPSSRRSRSPNFVASRDLPSRLTAEMGCGQVLQIVVRNGSF